MEIERIWEREQEILSRAESLLQLKESYHALLNEIAFQAQEKESFLQVEIISDAYRRATKRAGELLYQKHYQDKFELSEISWLSLGGEARREVTFRFDQDNAIIFYSSARKDFYREFAEELVNTLNWLGFRFCEGGVMASNPIWQGTLEEWKKRIQNLTSGPHYPEEIRNASILYDVDFVFGEKLYYQELAKLLREGFKSSEVLQRKMAEDIINIPPYIGLLGGLALETRPDRKGKFNFKFACLYPLTGYLRLEAWKSGFIIANSRQRVDFLTRNGTFTVAEGEKLTKLLANILKLRLNHQRKELKEKMYPSDYFDLRNFTPEELKLLKKCVREVEALKKRLRWLYWV